MACTIAETGLEGRCNFGEAGGPGSFSVHTGHIRRWTVGQLPLSSDGVWCLASLVALPVDVTLYRKREECSDSASSATEGNLLLLFVCQWQWLNHISRSDMPI